MNEVVVFVFLVVVCAVVDRMELKREERNQI